MGFFQNVAFFVRLFWGCGAADVVEHQVVAVFIQLWWFSGSCGGFQAVVVVFNQLWWFSGSCGDSLQSLWWRCYERMNAQFVNFYSAQFAR